MSDELRTWLEQVRDERNQAQVALQNGDDGPMRLWALRHGHVLIDKCEELAGAFGDVPGLLREIADNAQNGNAGEMERLVCTAAYLEDTADFLDAALRAPGGGGG